MTYANCLHMIDCVLVYFSFYEPHLVFRECYLEPLVLSSHSSLLSRHQSNVKTQIIMPMESFYNYHLNTGLLQIFNE